MRKPVRIIIALLFVMAMTSSLYAAGSIEKLPPTLDDLELPFESTSELLSQTPTTSGGFLNSIASVYDEITTAFCLGLTPFPNTLLQFYGDYGTSNDDASSELGLSEALLIGGDSYFDSHDGGTLDFGGRKYGGKSGEAQRATWNMITILFISFLLAEIVFTAIYHYVSDKDGSVIKEIIAKTVMAMAIFLIASALPFVIEVFRSGFVSAATVLTGIDDSIARYTENASNAPESADSLEQATESLGKKAIASLVQMRTVPVFYYPGILIRSVSDVFGLMDPDDIGGSGISIDDAGTKEYGLLAGALLNGLMEIVYLIVKLISSIMVLIAALHIMYNICEVYLLLGCVMLLLPFTIFSPLKFLGEKAVMSLFANVLELFVIVMIMFATTSIATTVTNGLLAALLSDVKSISIDMSFSNPTALADQNITTMSSETVLEVIEDLSDDEGTLRLTAYLSGPDGVNGYDSASGMFKETITDNAITGTYADVVDGIGLWIAEQWDETITALEKNNPDELFSLTKTLKFSYDNMGYPDDKYIPMLRATKFESLPAVDKLAVVNYIAGTAGAQFGMEVSKSASYERGLDPTMSPMDMYFMHLISFILIILMQTYFVNQSSQITNALLSGNVSSEGFTGALTRMAGAKALGAVGKAASMPGKALGGLGRFGLGAYGAKHEGTKRAAFANFAAGDNMSKLAGDLFGNKQKNQV